MESLSGLDGIGRGTYRAHELILSALRAMYDIHLLQPGLSTPHIVAHTLLPLQECPVVLHNAEEVRIWIQVLVDRIWDVRRLASDLVDASRKPPADLCYRLSMSTSKSIAQITRRPSLADVLQAFEAQARSEQAWTILPPHVYYSVYWETALSVLSTRLARILALLTNLQQTISEGELSELVRDAQYLGYAVDQQGTFQLAKLKASEIDLQRAIIGLVTFWETSDRTVSWRDQQRVGRPATILSEYCVVC